MPCHAITTTPGLTQPSGVGSIFLQASCEFLMPFRITSSQANSECFHQRLSRALFLFHPCTCRPSCHSPFDSAAASLASVAASLAFDASCPSEIADFAGSSFAWDQPFLRMGSSEDSWVSSSEPCLEPVQASGQASHPCVEPCSDTQVEEEVHTQLYSQPCQSAV